MKTGLSGWNLIPPRGSERMELQTSVMGILRERRGFFRIRVLDGVDSMDWPDRKLTNMDQMIQHSSSR